MLLMHQKGVQQSFPMQSAVYKPVFDKLLVRLGAVAHLPAFQQALEHIVNVGRFSLDAGTSIRVEQA